MFWAFINKEQISKYTTREIFAANLVPIVNCQADVWFHLPGHGVGVVHHDHPHPSRHRPPYLPLVLTMRLPQQPRLELVPARCAFLAKSKLIEEVLPLATYLPAKSIKKSSVLKISPSPALATSFLAIVDFPLECLIDKG